MKERDYKKEYEQYHGKKSKIKERASRNKARRIMAKQNRVSKGDGMHVDHKNGDPMDNRPSNLRVLKAKTNLSRNKD
jgi:hypothetical protein